MDRSQPDSALLIIALWLTQHAHRTIICPNSSVVLANKDLVFTAYVETAMIPFTLNHIDFLKGTSLWRFSVILLVGPQED